MKTKKINIVVIITLIVLIVLKTTTEFILNYQFLFDGLCIVLLIYLLITQLQDLKDIKKLISVTQQVETYFQDHSIVSFEKKLYNKHLNNHVYIINKILHYMHNKIDNKTRFNVNIAHEIRKPLTLLRNVIEINSFYKQHYFIKNVMEKVQELEDISKQLLLLSNVNDTTIRHTMKAVYLHTIFQNIFIEQQEFIKKKNITLIKDTSVLVPIHANQVLLKFAFANLIDNSIKYTHVNGKIHVKIKKKRNFIYCIIQDNGDGIKKDDQKLIFHPFYRATTHNIEGFGIGLSLAYNIFQLHSIECKIRSAKNQGTLLLLKIPF